MIDRILLELEQRVQATLDFFRSPLFHRPEWNIDGGMEMEFVMKRIEARSK